MTGTLESASARFTADLAALGVHGKLGLAVSGGPDSLALLLLAHEARPGGIEVASVDHGLRPESAAECAMVARLCEERGIRHRTLAVAIAAHGNLQANARAARYAALAEWAIERGLAAIVTAHHADDQAETLLMRLNRGAGVRGLGGMRGRAAVPEHHSLPLLRPLLAWRKAELVAVATSAGVEPATDPSNADPRFERAALRVRLADADWLDAVALATSARHLGDALDALEWATDREFADAVGLEEGAATYCPSAPRAVRIEVLRRLIGRLGSEGAPRGAELARLLDTLERGEVATLGGVRADGHDPRAWRFATAPPRASR